MIDFIQLEKQSPGFYQDTLYFIRLAAPYWQAIFWDVFHDQTVNQPRRGRFYGLPHPAVAGCTMTSSGGATIPHEPMTPHTAPLLLAGKGEFLPQCPKLMRVQGYLPCPPEVGKPKKLPGAKTRQGRQ